MHFVSVISALALLGAAAAQNVYVGAGCQAPGQYNCDTETHTTMMVCNAQYQWVMSNVCGQGCCVAGESPTCNC